MVPYKKDGHDFILVANSSLGLLKLKADNLETYKPIDSPSVVNVAGVPYDSLSNKNVSHIAELDASNALILVGKPGAGPAYNPGPAQGPINLQTIALP
jgi:hypothetical protein